MNEPPQFDAGCDAVPERVVYVLQSSRAKPSQDSIYQRGMKELSLRFPSLSYMGYLRIRQLYGSENSWLNAVHEKKKNDWERWSNANPETLEQYRLWASRHGYGSPNNGKTSHFMYVTWGDLDHPTYGDKASRQSQLFPDLDPHDVFPEPPPDSSYWRHRREIRDPQSSPELGATFTSNSDSSSSSESESPPLPAVRRRSRVIRSSQGQPTDTSVSGTIGMLARPTYTLA